MTNKPKTIQEALAEVQRKVNEERVEKVKAEWEAVEEGTALVPYNAVKQTDWRTVSKVPKTTSPPPVSSSSAIPKVAGALGRVAGPIATGASIGGTVSDLLGKVATGTETGRSVGKWIGQNVPGAKTAADAMRKAGEAIGVREPAAPATTQTPAAATSTTAVPTPPKRPSQTDLNKMSRDKALRDAGSNPNKYSHTETTLKQTAPGEQAKMQSTKSVKGWADPGRWENEVRSKTGTMQQIRTDPKRHVVDTATQQLGKPSASSEKSTQSFLDKELGRTPAASSTPASTMNPQQRWEASKKETGVSDTTAKAQTTAVQSRPSGEKSTSDFLKSQGVGVSTEDGKKKKMSEDTNPLIASFLALQEKNPSNMFVEAKKLSKKQDEKLDVVDDDKIDAKDFAALRAGKKKVEEESADYLGSSTVTKEKKGYVDPSTPTEPYKKAPMSTAAGDVLSKAKNALDKTGVKEENESLFSEAELEHINSFFLEASVAPTRPEVAAEARPDKINDGVSQNDVTGTAESGKRKVKEEVELEEGMPASVIASKKKYAEMSDKDFAEKHGHKSEKELRDMAARHGYGWDKATKTGSDHYVKRVAAANKINEEHKSMEGETLKPGDQVGYKEGHEKYGHIHSISPEGHAKIKVWNDNTGDYHHVTKHVSKLWKEGTNEEAILEGRPRKNPVASGEESPVKNIAAQVRTARSVTNDGGKSYHIPLKHPVSGKIHHVPQKAVDDFNKSYAAARKADEKEAVETAFKTKHMSE